MALYTLSEFMKTVKEDMGISELPKTITDAMMIDRFRRSGLAIFSQLCPQIVDIRINDNELLKDENYFNNTPNGKFYKYQIPKFAYGDRSIISVVNVEPCRANVCNDYYMGYNVGYQALLNVLSAIADVRAAATVMQQCYPSMTWDFKKPDILTIFNGYCGETYQVSLLMSHDIKF